MKLLRIFIVLMTILAVSWGSISIFFYGHFHIDENGHVLFHSHPVHTESTRSATFPEHHHSRQEMLILAILTQIFTLLAGFIVLVLIGLRLLHRFLLVIQNSLLLHFFYTRISRRGPPAVFTHA